jgi:tetratricopeptide (TPR) repeat protein
MPEYVTALARLTAELYAVNLRDRGDDGIRRIERIDTGRAGPVARARVALAYAHRAIMSNDPLTFYRYADEARKLFEEAGDRRGVCGQAANLGYIATLYGAYEDADALLAPNVAVAMALGIKGVEAAIKRNLGFLRYHQGRVSEAIALLLESAERFEAGGELHHEAASRVYLSMALVSRDVDEARAVCERALALGSGDATLRVRARGLAHLATLDLESAHPNVERALAEATEAIAILERVGVEGGEWESRIRAAYTEALLAAGRIDEAKRSAENAVRELEQVASTIPERWRASYMEMSYSARTYALAQQLGSMVATK